MELNSLLGRLTGGSTADRVWERREADARRNRKGGIKPGRRRKSTQATHSETEFSRLHREHARLKRDRRRMRNLHVLGQGGALPLKEER